MLVIPPAVTNVLPGESGIGGDAVAVAIAVVTFVILYWLIGLFDRV